MKKKGRILGSQISGQEKEYPFQQGLLISEKEQAGVSTQWTSCSVYFVKWGL